MTDAFDLEAFLRTDPQDVGCDEALSLLAVYVDVAALRSWADAKARYPGVAAHLLACGPCGTDYEALLMAVRAWGAGAPDESSS